MTSGYLPDNLGGTPLHVQALIRGLPRSDFDVRVLASAHDPQDEEYAVRQYRHDGITVSTINNTVRDADNFFFLYSAPGIDRAFREVLDAFDPDLVHVHHLTRLSTNILSMLRQDGIPTVMTLHDYWMICPRGQRIDPDGERQDEIDRDACRRCIRTTWPFLFPEEETDLHVRSEREMLAAWDDHILRALNGVDRLIVPSAFYAESFATHGVSRDRMTVIPHGLDHAPFEGVAAARTPAAKTRVAYLGTVIPSKGVHLLLEAARGLGDRITVEIHGEVVPYHQDDQYESRLRAAVPDEVEVTFHGRYLPQAVAEIFRTVDILVVPSIWHEAFGLTVREGFLAGVPVIAANHGGLAEAIADDRGLGFASGDAADLRRQLVRLLDDETLRERVRGRPEWVRSLDDMVRDTLRVYGDAAKEREHEEPRADGFRQPFRDAVARVRARSRRSLLEDAAKGLRTLEARLGVESHAADLLTEVATHAWPIAEEFRTHRSESDWLRTERESLSRELESLRRGLEETRTALESEVAEEKRRVASLEEERDWHKSDKVKLQAQVEDTGTNYQRLLEEQREHYEKALEEKIRHASIADAAAADAADGYAEIEGRLQTEMAEKAEALGEIERLKHELHEARTFLARLRRSRPVRWGMKVARIKDEGAGQ